MGSQGTGTVAHTCQRKNAKGQGFPLLTNFQA